LKCRQYERYRRTGGEQAEIELFPLVVWVLPDEKHVGRLEKALQADRRLDRGLFRLTTAGRIVDAIEGATP
jgi:hypothetical protein